MPCTVGRYYSHICYFLLSYEFLSKYCKALGRRFSFFFVFISRREWAIFTYLYFLPSYYFLFFKYRNRFSSISYFEFKEYFWFWYNKLKFKYASRFLIFWLTHLWMLQFRHEFRTEWFTWISECILEFRGKRVISTIYGNMSLTPVVF